jgi:hypothetical protein
MSAMASSVQRILCLHRERYGPRHGHPGFNVRHFYHLARRDHGVTLPYNAIGPEIVLGIRAAPRS